MKSTNSNTGEVDINYIVGPNNGPALVLIQELMSWESYHHVLVPLSKNFMFFSVDIPGNGKSGCKTEDYSWKSVGRDIRAFLKEIVKVPAVISGYSLGGLIALDFENIDLAKLYRKQEFQVNKGAKVIRNHNWVINILSIILRIHKPSDHGNI